MHLLIGSYLVFFWTPFSHRACCVLDLGKSAEDKAEPGSGVGNPDRSSEGTGARERGEDQS